MADTVSSIRINTKLVTDGIKKDKKEIERQLRELQKNAQSVKISKEIDKYNSALEKSGNKINALEEKYSKVEKQTQSIKENALEQIKKDSNVISETDIIAKQAMDALPSNATDEERSAAAAEAYNERINEILEVKLKTSKEYQKQLQLQDEANQKLESEKQNYNDLLVMIQNKQNELELIKNLEKETISEMFQQRNQLDEQARLAKEKARSELQAAKNAEKHSRALKRGLKTMLRMSLSVLGIRSAYLALRKIVSSVTDENKALKNTIDSIWIGLGVVFEPIITGLVKGFATVLNYAFAVIQALTGINVLAKANERLAKKNADSSGNSLASFDKSEVIKKDSESGTSATDSYLKEIELNEKLLSIIEQIKETWSSVFEVLQPVGEYIWTNLLVPIGEWLSGAIESILSTWAEGLNELSNTFADFSPEISDSLMGLVDTLVVLWESVVRPLLDAIVFGVQLTIQACVEFLKGFMMNLQFIIDDIKLILEGIINFILGVFTGNWERAWLGVQQIFAGIWNGMIDIVQSVLDGIARAINAIVDAINSLSFTVPEWVPYVGGSTFSIGMSGAFTHVTAPDLSSYKWEVPMLAKGAVLPPNQPFVAMLGDQTRGRNLEAPEGLIRQIIQEELSGLTNGTQVIIKADGDLGALIRLLRFEIDEEENRTGTQLVLEG